MIQDSFVTGGDLTVHVRVNDPDFDVSASGEDQIAGNTAADPVGPVKLSIIRGSETVVLGYAGGPDSVEGVIDVDDNGVTIGTSFVNDVDGDGVIDPEDSAIRQFGPIEEIAPDAGIFEIDIPIRYTDGPASSICPDTTDYEPINGASRYCS